MDTFAFFLTLTIALSPPHLMKAWNKVGEPYGNGDGSGFVSDVLGMKLTVVKCHDAIEHEDGFRQIDNIDDVKPGDIIAIKNPPDGRTRGHVLIVSGYPEPWLDSDDKPVATDVFYTIKWSIVVIDSARVRTIEVYTWESGKIAGHNTLSDDPWYVSQLAKHLVIGRLK